MSLDLPDCSFRGPALPLPFVQFELTGLLRRHGLLSSPASLARLWSKLRGQLRLLGSAGGPQRVHNHIIVPLAPLLGFPPPTREQPVATREGLEDGGWLLTGATERLRCWTVAVETDLDAPNRSGRAYRFSPARSASRVLLATGERMGLLANGEELRLLLCDPARPDSHVAIALSPVSGWRGRTQVPDSCRLLLALAAPRGQAALPAILEAARYSQARVTKELRVQARQAIEGFLQAVLDHAENAETLDRHADRQTLAATLWREGLVLTYRMLFIFKLESAHEPERGFGFAATALWRGALSPNRALGPLVRRLLDHGHDTGRMLENGLRTLFRLFRDGIVCSEIAIAPLGGALFGTQATPLINKLAWGDRAVALLLDRLLWTRSAGGGRERVQYASLDIEDLGRVYEALLELEPDITTQLMTRWRRARLEVVVPAKRQPASSRFGNDKTSAIRIEDIPAGRFILRAGFGRKTTGSYYTPHEIVHFLVRETLTPELRRRSPDDDPDPGAILALNVLDPTVGSGHFLVEACRFLGDALYAACRLCDELATAAEAEALVVPPSEQARLLGRAAALRQRVMDLPDPDGVLLAYLPSRVAEGRTSGISQGRAIAICRRLIAVHCLYGVDQNALAVELTKLSLWLESYAEGMPLTFLDHRIICGDSVCGARFADLGTLPVSRGELDPLLARGVTERLNAVLQAALSEIAALEASVGSNAANLVVKQRAKDRLDAALQPLRRLACAWSGAVMLGTRNADDEWLALAHDVAANGVWPAALTPCQAALLEAGSHALPWDMNFPEVFRPDGFAAGANGFDVILSNPPWDIILPRAKEFLAGLDLSILDLPTRHEARAIQRHLLAEPMAARAFARYQDAFARQARAIARLYRHQSAHVAGAATSGKLDSFRVFAERNYQLLSPLGAVGMLVPSAFHANEGATGVRQLYLQLMCLEWCLSFENRRKLFEIDSRFKFAAIVARRPGPTTRMRCGFYLTAFSELDQPGRLLDYDRQFIEAAGGPYTTFLEVRDALQLTVAQHLFGAQQNFGEWIAERGIQLSRDLHMTDDSERFTPLTERLYQKRYLLLHEGKSIHQFTDRWENAPRYAVSPDRLADKPRSLRNAAFFRVACREIARATDDRSVIAAMLPPGVVCGHTLNVERAPEQRSNASALILLALLNSFAFDWMLRQKSAAHASLYILASLAAPAFHPAACRFLAHAALRLSCNDQGFAPLWHEQLAAAWHEATPYNTWPVLAHQDARWWLRAAIDAVVAQAYGLTEQDYSTILGSFGHRSFPAAPDYCRSAFAAMAAEGLEQFCRAHDPYCATALPTRLARPAVEIPGPDQPSATATRSPRGRRLSA